MKNLSAVVTRLCADAGVTDARETALFTRELEQILTQTYNIEYPELKARSFVPAKTGIGNAIERITYRQWDRTTTAKIISRGDMTLPGVTVFGKEFSSGVVSMGNYYGYTVQDLRAAAASGQSLDNQLAAAAREGHELLLEELVAFGNPESNMPGLLNHPNIPVISATTGNWASATTDQILADLRGISLAIYTATKGTRTADTILFDTASFSLLNKPVGADYSTTILQTFLKNDPYIKNVDQWIKLDTADAALTGPRLLVYKRDPQVLELYVPQEFEQFAPQLQGLEFKINCHSRTGGVVVRYPLAMAYVDNHL